MSADPAHRADLRVERRDHAGIVTICRPPYNYIDADFVGVIADAFERLGRASGCRAIILRAEGKAFCAGAHFSADSVAPDAGTMKQLYGNAGRIFDSRLPVIAVVEGPAVGAGFGLALAADFRIATPSARFAANFVKLGIHPGFGMTVTLPRLIGQQAAQHLFYTGRDVAGEEALRLGLVDELAQEGAAGDSASRLAADIAAAAPLAVRATRETMRRGLAKAVRERTDLELAAQLPLFATQDFRIGVAAVASRQPPRFIGS